jgi:hypothetical protein
MRRLMASCEGGTATSEWSGLTLNPPPKDTGGGGAGAEGKMG